MNGYIIGVDLAGDIEDSIVIAEVEIKEGEVKVKRMDVLGFNVNKTIVSIYTERLGLSGSIFSENKGSKEEGIKGRDKPIQITPSKTTLTRDKVKRKRVE